jgi:hypothetical protein
MIYFLNIFCYLINSQETSEGKPPVDLFAAIFGNTDSEDSDEEEEADNQSHDMETTNPSVPTTQGIYCVPSWIFNVMVFFVFS